MLDLSDNKISDVGQLIVLDELCDDDTRILEQLDDLCGDIQIWLLNNPVTTDGGVPTYGKGLFDYTKHISQPPVK